MNYERSRGGSGRPKEQSEGDLTRSAVICLSADPASVERLWCHLPPSPAKLGLVLQLLRRSFSNASLAEPWLGRAGKCRTRSPAKGCRCCSKFRAPAQSPGAASRSGSGWAIHCANSLLPLRASPRDTGNGGVDYKLTEGADYCWRRSRVIKDWSGGRGGGGGNRT